MQRSLPQVTPPMRLGADQLYKIRTHSHCSPRTFVFDLRCQWQCYNICGLSRGGMGGGCGRGEVRSSQIHGVWRNLCTLDGKGVDLETDEEMINTGENFLATVLG